MISRRAFASSLAVLATGAVGCERRAGVVGKVRVGFLTNLAHAPMIAAIASGRLARALGGVAIEVRTFRAGPRICEALLGGALDVALCGPGPLVAMHARHAGAPIRVVSGAASGGSSFVTLPSIEIAADLAGRQVATVQIGCTQDVSLRKWLARNGLRTKERGGDVTVTALAAANVLEEMRRGAIAGAWLQEPWATKVASDLGATRLLDERDLWPERRFPTALLVARRGFLERRPGDVGAVVRAIEAEVAWLAREPEAGRELVFGEIARITTRALPRAIVEGSWARVDFTTDPMPAAIEILARDAHDLGYVPHADVRGLVV